MDISGIKLELKIGGSFKMKKVLTVSALSLATFSAVQTAKADETQTNSGQTDDRSTQVQQQQVSPVDQAQSKVTEAQTNVNVKQNEVNQAQAKADQAQANLETTQNEYNDAANKEQQAANDVNQAKQAQQDAEKTAENATPENIQSTKDDIAQTQQQITDQQTQVDQAQSDYDASQKVVEDEQNKVNDAQSTVDQAQTKVDQAQAIVDNSSAKDAQAKVDQAQANLQQAEQDKQSVEQQISSTEQEINSNQNKVNNAQSTVDQTKSDLNTANERVDQAKTNVDNANKVVSTQQSKVNDLQSKVDSLKDQIDNVVVVPQMPENAMKEILANNVSAKTVKMLQDMFMDPKTFNIHKEYLYHGPKSDKNRPVNYADLTYDQAKELTLFTADLINQYRLQAGLPPVKVNEDSILYAMEVGRKSNVKNYHDDKVLFEVQKSHNVHTYENLHKSYMTAELGSMNTMYGLKAAAFLGVTGMMFNDARSSWGHAYTILSSHENDDFETKDNAFLGVSTDKFGNVHYEFIYPITLYKDNFAHLNTKEHQFSQQNLIDIPDNAATIKEYNDQKNKLATENATLDNLRSVAQKAERSYTIQLNSQKDAQTKVEQAQTTLAQAKDALVHSQVQLAKLKQDQQAAVNKVAVATKNLEQAQNVLKAVEVEFKSELEKLAQAKEELNTAKNQLAQAKTNLSQVVATSDDKKTELEKQITKLNNLKAQLVQKQAQLESYEKAGVNLAKANENYAAKQAEHVAAKQALTFKATKLDQAKAEYETAKAVLDKTTDELVQLQSELTQAQNDLAQALKERSEEEQRRREQEKELQRVENELAVKDKGYHEHNGQVVDQNGKQVSGWTTKNDKLVDPAGNEFTVVSKEVSNDTTETTTTSFEKNAQDSATKKAELKKQAQVAVPQASEKATVTARDKVVAQVTATSVVSETSKGEQKQGNTLPQTGDKSEMGLVSLGFTMILGMLGVNIFRKKRVK